MGKLIRAELRKSWKTYRFFMAILCFLCFMACAYVLDLSKGLAYHYQETPYVRENYNITSSRYNQLHDELQNTPKELETPYQRAQHDIWEDAYNKTFRYLLLRQEYDGYIDRITQVAYDYANSIYTLRTSEYYENDFEQYGEEYGGIGISLERAKLDKDYYKYMLDHDIVMYENANEPNVCNFLIYMFQNETMILFVIIAAFFLIDAICGDFDGGCYTLVYTQPHSRLAMMCAKMISVLIMLVISFLVSFILFTPWLFIQHGFGYLDYPYIVGNQILSYGQFLIRILALVGMQLLFFLSVCILVANLFKNITNTLLFVAGLLLIQYLVNLFIGVRSWYSWLPIFFIEPFKIVMGDYPLSPLMCIGVSILFIAAIFILFIKFIKRIDLKGSEAL